MHTTVFEFIISLSSSQFWFTYFCCLPVWCEGKALGYRFGGHAFKPCHRTYTVLYAVCCWLTSPRKLNLLLWLLASWSLSFKQAFELIPLIVIIVRSLFLLLVNNNILLNDYTSLGLKSHSVTNYLVLISRTQS